jgi:hypothetical protein
MQGAGGPGKSQIILKRALFFDTEEADEHMIEADKNKLIFF